MLQISMLKKTNQLLGLLSCTISPLQIFKMPAGFTYLISILSLFSLFYITPKFVLLAEENTKKIEDKEFFLFENFTLKLTDNCFLFAGSFQKDSFRNLKIVFLDDKLKIKKVIYAAEAKVEGNICYLKDGNLQLINPSCIKEFKEKRIFLPFCEDDLCWLILNKPQFLTINELLRQISLRERLKICERSFEVEIFFRIMLAFGCIVFFYFCLIFGLRLEKSSFSSCFGICVLVAFLYWTLILFSKSVALYFLPGYFCLWIVIPFFFFLFYFRGEL